MKPFGLKSPAWISLIAISLATAICLTSSAAATPILIYNIDFQHPNGKLTGVNGVEVAGSLYDVKFVIGTCVAAHPTPGTNVCIAQPMFQGDLAQGGSDDGSAMAQAATQALIDQVFGPPLFATVNYYGFYAHHGSQSIPSIFRNPSDQATFVLTPFGWSNSTAWSVRQDLPNPVPYGSPYGPVQYYPQTYIAGQSFAVWTPEAMPTPEPGSFLLFGSGLGIAITGVRRKLRR